LTLVRYAPFANIILQGVYTMLKEYSTADFHNGKWYKHGSSHDHGSTTLRNATFTSFLA
jgi:hypothetical protein